jgi:hypothetical protein
MNDTKQEPTTTTLARYRTFVPLVSEVNGPTRRCSLCGGYEHEHNEDEKPSKPTEPPLPYCGRTPGDFTAIPNADRGPFRYTIVALPTLKNVAQVFAQRWINHGKVEDDPEAAANAALFRAAPKLLDAGRKLTTTAKRINDLQHAGDDVPPGLWSDLYRFVNEMDAAIVQAQVDLR